MRVPGKVPAAIAAVLAGVLVAGGCSGVDGRPVPTRDVVVDAVEPDFVYGTDGGRIDTLAATVVTDAQDFWSRAYPRHFPGRWHDLDGGFFSVDTTRTAGDPPPCTSEVSDVAGNAYYCATVDAMAWDRAALLPVLREHYGAAAVVVVLAHEMGHAVQHRAAQDPRSQARSDDLALAELVADCYAGAYTRWVVSGNSRHLRIREQQLDGAMLALAGFRDPLATPGAAGSAHGSALDRVAAFQDGYRAGPGLCADMTAENRVLTSERGLATPAPGERGNERAGAVLRSHARRLDTYFDGLARRLGHGRQPPEITREARCADTAGSDVIAYCPREHVLVVDHRRLDALNYEIGDQASATVLASRYALAFLRGRGHSRKAPPSERARAETAACLTGAYTRWLGDGHGTGPTAADLDEAISALLSGRAVTDPGVLSGFDAVAAFRSGSATGASACR